MQMDLSLYQKLEMRMRLAPQIIQSIEILQLATLELQQRLNQELLENPVLEQVEPELEEAETEETHADDRSPDESEFEKMQDMEDHIRDYSSQAPAPRVQRGERDPKLEAMQNTAARTLSLQEHLARQLSMLDFEPRARRIAENIIYNLDDNGYLQYPLSELVDSMPSGTTAEEAERVLFAVQSLDPPGIGARDLKECLLLQLREDTSPQSNLVRQIISNHLDDLRMNRFPKIVKDTGHTLEEIRDAADFICHLSPKPGSIFSTEQPQYVLPDVRIEQNESGEYEVVMCDDYIPRVRVSGQYLHVMQSATSTKEEKEYIKRKMQAARWIIDAIEQRRNTLKKIMEEIVKHQREFFDKGIHFLKPLRMGIVAKAAGIHVSTVSRAISHKYVDTPSGLYEIRFFFAGSVQANTQDPESTDSRESVQAVLRDLIDKEDKRNPMSDVDLINALKERGIEVARRTITKYRQLMNIPPSRQRIQY